MWKYEKIYILFLLFLGIFKLSYSQKYYNSWQNDKTSAWREHKTSKHRFITAKDFNYDFKVFVDLDNDGVNEVVVLKSDNPNSTVFHVINQKENYSDNLLEKYYEEFDSIFDEFGFLNFEASDEYGDDRYYELDFIDLNGDGRKEIILTTSYNMLNTQHRSYVWEKVRGRYQYVGFMGSGIGGFSITNDYVIVGLHTHRRIWGEYILKRNKIILIGDEEGFLR